MTARRSRGRESGATLIETAIVSLVVLLFFLAILEFGLVFRDNLSTSDAVADAVRIGAVVGNGTAEGGTNADFQAVKTVREGLSGISDDDIETIVVFKATGTSESATEQIPAACKGGQSVPGICNAYPAGPAFRAITEVPPNVAYFECVNAGDPACGWEPETRTDGPTSADVETVGVYVRVERPGVTGLFADTWTIERAMTLRLEPGVIEE